MMQAGAYDEVFKGAVCVFHAAAEMGNLEGSTPLKVYEGGVDATKLSSTRLRNREVCVDWSYQLLCCGWASVRKVINTQKSPGRT